MAYENQLIRLESVEHQYDGTITALKNVNLDVKAGECLAITGPSGSGKTTLLNVFSGIELPTGGKIYWNGLPIHSRKEWTEVRRKKIGIIFQDFKLLPTLSAIENVEVAMLGQAISGLSRRTRAIKALECVGLLERINHLPSALSGGERQRVALARAVVNTPELLLADEPTGNLDSASAAHVIDLLLRLQKDTAATLVLITHDEKLATRCKRCVFLRDGQIVSDRLARPKSRLATLAI